MRSPKTILKAPYFAVSLTCGLFGSTVDNSSGLLHRTTGSVQLIIVNRRNMGHSGPTCTKQLCHLNGCSNTNAELTCCLVQVEIAIFVLKFDISSIILWEHVNLNAAYILSRSYRIKVFEGKEKVAPLFQLLGLRQCILCQGASQRILGDRLLFVIRGGSNLTYGVRHQELLKSRPVAEMYRLVPVFIAVYIPHIQATCLDKRRQIHAFDRHFKKDPQLPIFSADH